MSSAFNRFFIILAIMCGFSFVMYQVKKKSAPKPKSKFIHHSKQIQNLPQKKHPKSILPSKSAKAKKAPTSKPKPSTQQAKTKKATGFVTTASGLKYKILKQGTGAQPQRHNRVSVHYTGWFYKGTKADGTLIKGRQFDSSRTIPSTFHVTGVIQGWTEALLQMKAGEVRMLYVPSALAYGSGGRGAIPGNSNLIFKVELLQVK